MNCCVVTTINEPTEAIKVLSEKFDGNLIVIGDNKTPENWSCPGARFYYKEIQDKMDTNLILPENHYARKNLGYLIAIKGGAKLIYDTDDDNIPNENWKIRELECDAITTMGSGWFNPYRSVTDVFCWPRGYPLQHIDNSETTLAVFLPNRKHVSPIQQGLADGEADVDAVYRLTNGEQIYFETKRSINLSDGLKCPFNSQSTWWFPKAFPLMYLPVYAPFRMTDIWRSFVAQRCLWEMGYGVTFHSPSEVFQKRNEHDLLKDFEDEIQGYLRNDEIVETLNGLSLGKSVSENMLTCYKSLVDIGVLPEKEIESVKAWLTEVNK